MNIHSVTIHLMTKLLFRANNFIVFHFNKLRDKIGWERVYWRGELLDYAKYCIYNLNYLIDILDTDI